MIDRHHVFRASHKTKAKTQPANPKAMAHKNNEDRERPRKAPFPSRDALAGTTRRVYRYIYRRGPARLHEIQRDLRLSSSSVADYHVQKLLQMRLIREERTQDGVVGYAAEEAVFEAMIRIKRTVIPLWTTASAFFAASLIVLVTILRPTIISSTYLFSLVVAVVALAISAYETVTSFSGDGI
jgi:predicted DNA-binding transcriptional regulator